MDEDRLGYALRTLSDTPLQFEAGAGFRDAVWQRVGEMSEARDRRGRAILGAAIILVSLTTGLGSTFSPAMAEPVTYAISDGSELAPSTLLHVSP